MENCGKESDLDGQDKRTLRSKCNSCLRYVYLLSSYQSKNNEGGVENTRLHPSMNIQDRLGRLDEFVFELTRKLDSLTQINDMQRSDIDKGASDHFKLSEVVTSHGNRLRDQGKEITAVKGELVAETSDRVKGDKVLKEYISNTLEKKLDSVEKKTWENANLINSTESHLVKIENKVNDNSENISSIQVRSWS